MVQFHYIFDNFNDNSIDGRLWSPGSGSTLQNETGGRLNTPISAASTITSMRTQGNWFDLRRGRLAVRYSRSGTTSPDIYTFFGVRDINNYGYYLWARSNDPSFQIAVNDFGVGTQTNVDTTVGLGPSWVANHWIGWSYNEGTKTYILAKSADGITWTNIHTYQVTGTAGAFNFKQAGLMLSCATYGGATNFTPSWDDVSYFVQDTTLRTRVRYNGAWVYASPKVRVNGVWERPISKVRSGGLWVRPQ